MLTTLSGRDKSERTTMSKSLSKPDRFCFRNCLLALIGFLACHPALAAVPGYYRQINLFGTTNLSGLFPSAPLLEASDGRLYGTTLQGGAPGFDFSGTIFGVNKNGGAPATLHVFGHDYPAGGVSPAGGVIEGRDGMLYGAAQGGGVEDGGILFRLQKHGGGFQVLHTFIATNGDGAQPAGGLLQGSDGALYGTTLSGGGSGLGTIFRFPTNGTGYSILHSFTNRDTGAAPLAALIEGSDGALYGTTPDGGTNDAGTVFALDKDGGNFRVLHHFLGEIGFGRGPSTRLLEGSDGLLYGTTARGGQDTPSGIVFRLNKNGTGFTPVLQFSDGIGDGNGLPSALTEAPDGYLYGTTLGGGVHDVGLAYRVQKDGSEFFGLHHFPNDVGDGSGPQSGLTLASDGSFYGTASQGADFGFGMFFKLSLTAPSPVLRIEPAGLAGMQITLTEGANHQNYALEASTNLTSTNAWRALSTQPANVEGRIHFSDPNPATNQWRFFRARAVP